MNPNGKLIRDNRIALNFNQYEIDLIMAHCKLFGHEPAAFCRKLILQQAKAKLEQSNIIAYYLPSTGTMHIPLSHAVVPVAHRHIAEV